MKKILLLVVCLVIVVISSGAQPLSQKMAATAMRLWPDSTARWGYEPAVSLRGIDEVWKQTADKQYFSYIQKYMDKLIDKDGNMKGYRPEEYQLDHILDGRIALMLYKVTKAEKYYKAVTQLRRQLNDQPRIPEGGFWHKKKYENQMWLDGLYMGDTFYADYAATFGETSDFDDIANQFILIEQHTRDPKTGLLYHAWDESRKEKWANPKTGLSANFWARADGWYGMALVDVLDDMPADHPKRAELIAILNRFAAAVTKYQDAKSGAWYEVMDKSTEKGNYLESSASCMFVYALAKGVRMGYLPQSYLVVADKGYKGIVKTFIETGANGQLSLNGTVSVGGLGGTPNRDGSFPYYISEKVVTNDPKGVGAFIQAAVEMERLEHLKEGNGKLVLLDSYFNDEHKKDPITGNMVSWHYKWDEMNNDGFSFFGHVFNNYGFKTETSYAGPTTDNLKKASVYIIVDPDIPKENKDAKYIEAPHIQAITDWLKAGGVLVVLNNDTGNAEFAHLNNLLAKFGMRFNLDSRNHVVTPHFETGAIDIPAGNEIFKAGRKIYIKEIATLAVTPPAKSALTDKNDVIIAMAKYGQGTVFAVGDPWFYNEYTNGLKLPSDYENFQAANDLVRWIVNQSAK